jgi:toxin ParE1/3/4
MWQITLSEEAEKDFSRILRYTGDTFGPLQAEIYEKTILSAIARLDAGPEILGSIDRDELRPGVRSLHVAQQGRRGRHFIVYRAVASDAIEIVRILHDAMDLARHIPPETD